MASVGVSYKFESNIDDIIARAEEKSIAIEEETADGLVAAVDVLAPKSLEGSTQLGVRHPPGWLAVHHQWRRTIGLIGDIHPGGIIVSDEPTSFYGMFVEFGTRRMLPRPYMTPALEAARPAFNDRVEEALNSLLEDD